MLKKTVSAAIIPTHRICKKCSATVSVNPTEDKTYCHICGEKVYAEATLASRDSESEQKDS